MSSDLHFGHRNIGKYRADIGLDTSQKNEDAICDEWSSLIKKRDIVYILGDAAFTENAVDLYQKLPGTKYLIPGNHDNLPMTSYLRAFDKVMGCISYKRFWLSHFPIHPLELRKRPCIHGHVHTETIPDSRYINVCCDHLYKISGSFFVKFQDIKNKFTLDENNWYL